MPSITTCAIEATIEFDSFGQVDSKQAFHVALLVKGGTCAISCATATLKAERDGLDLALDMLAGNIIFSLICSGVARRR